MINAAIPFFAKAMPDEPKPSDAQIDEDYILTPVGGEADVDPTKLIGSFKERVDPEVRLMGDPVPTRAALRRTTKSLCELTFFGRITQSRWLVCYLIAAGIAAAVYWVFLRG